jgi:tRNA (mo5U34)-methyltransferase
MGTRERAEEIIRECPEWYHSIELAPGVITPGREPSEAWARKLHDLRLPDLRGKSVLDIGAYDGYFSFAAERLGASRVTALDHYVWSTDMVEYMKDWRKSRESGAPLPPPHESRHWRPAELPGRRPFDAARAFLGSKVEPVVGDFMAMDLTSLGRFDVVLFLGVLYHLEDPLRAMRRLAAVTAPAGLAVIETEAVEVPRMGHAAFCEFFPGQELGNDPSNWWSPNAKALEGLCRAAGFQRVILLTDSPHPPWRPLGTRLGSAFRHLIVESHLPQRLGLRVEGDAAFNPMRYRAIAHAYPTHSSTRAVLENRDPNGS